MSLELIYRAKAVWYEGLIAVGIGLIIVANIVATDISFHDDYVGFIIEQCHPDNQSKFCNDIREHLGVEMTDQIEIGNNYWNRLYGQALELFAILFIIRMAFGLMLWKMGIRRIRITTVLMAVIWGASATVLFTFAMVDTMYFVFQGMEIPSELPYLDGGAVTQYTKEWTGNPNTVGKNDLFLTNIVGFLILVGLITFDAIVFHLKGFSNKRNIS